MGSTANEKDDNKGIRTKEKDDIDYATSAKEEKQDALMKKKNFLFKNKNSW